MQSREPAALVRARRLGYLDARRPGAQSSLRPYALWCWRMKLPLVWLEKRTPCSRYAKVHLDLFTTTTLLSARGLAELNALGACAPSASPHDASWGRVPARDAPALAHAAMRCVLRQGNTEPNRVRQAAKLLRMEAAA